MQIATIAGSAEALYFSHGSSSKGETVFNHVLQIYIMIATLAVAACSDDLPHRKNGNKTGAQCNDADHCSRNSGSEGRSDEASGEMSDPQVYGKEIVIILVNPKELHAPLTPKKQN